MSECRTGWLACTVLACTRRSKQGWPATVAGAGAGRAAAAQDCSHGLYPRSPGGEFAHEQWQQGRERAARLRKFAMEGAWSDCRVCATGSKCVLTRSRAQEDTTFKRKPSSPSRQPEVRAHEPIAPTEPRLRLSPRSRSSSAWRDAFTALCRLPARAGHQQKCGWHHEKLTRDTCAQEL